MIVVTHSKTLVAPDSGVEDKVYGSDYVDPASHTVALGSDDNFVTDAQLVVIANTSNVNSGDQTNITGNAGTVTTNANLTGPITSTGNATAVAAQTGTGSVFAMQASPTFTTLITTPAINGGVAANDDITIQGTTHTTRDESFVYLQRNGGQIRGGLQDASFSALVQGYLATPSGAKFAYPGQIGVLGVAETSSDTNEAVGLYGVASRLVSAANGLYGFGAEVFNLADTGVSDEVFGGFTYAGNLGDGDVSFMAGVVIYGNENGGAGEITENSGLFVEDQTAGVDNWAILTGLGAVEFGSNVTVTGSVRCDAISNDTGLAAGKFTPTRSAEVNTTGNAAPSEGQYLRVGNTVTMSGRFTVTATLTATATSFEMTLPVASNFGAVEDCAGVAFCGVIAGMGAEIIGVVANDTAKVQWVSSDITSRSWSYTFTYEAI